MDSISLRWLRLIASGVPLLTIAATASLNLACKCPPSVTRRHISSEQLSAAIRSDGSLDRELCEALCREGDVYFEDAGDGALSFTLSDCRVDERPLPRVICTWEQSCPGGRRASGASTTSCTHDPDLGAVLAGLAHREAASVVAFEELAHALMREGAPESLSRRALACADDERQHARAVHALAVRFGSGDVLDVPAPTRVPSLAELLALNAVEGCVRETYGALVAAHQADHASDAEIRSAFGAIARDEARHGLFSFALHDFARTHLDEATFDTLERARHEAAVELLAGSFDAPSEAIRKAMGLPSAHEARALAAVVCA